MVKSTVSAGNTGVIAATGNCCSVPYSLGFTVSARYLWFRSENERVIERMYTKYVAVILQMEITNAE